MSSLPSPPPPPPPHRAKSIKNKVAVNVELTAEEWRRRFEKEREVAQKLKYVVQQYEAELERWRAGENVPEGERAKLKVKNVQLPVSGTEESHSLMAQNAPPTLQVAAPGSLLTTPGSTPCTTPTPVQTRAFEEERTRLCQQLDEKVSLFQIQNLTI